MVGDFFGRIPGPAFVERQKVVKGQADLQQPFIAFDLGPVVGKQHGAGIDEVGGDVFHGPALPQGFPHQTIFHVRQVAQAAVDELGRGRRGGFGKIPLFEKNHPQPSTGSLVSKGRPGNAAADDNDVEYAFRSEMVDIPFHF